MKKQVVQILMTLAIAAVAILLVAHLLPGVTPQDADTVDINRVIAELNEKGVSEKQVYDFVAVDKSGAVVLSTVTTEDMSLKQRVTRAYQAGDAVADWEGGKIVFYTNSSALWSRTGSLAFWIAAGGIALTALLSVATYAYYSLRILRPFRRLQSFATEVTKGNFDAPLAMDKGQNFGAFTEAFDLMRQSLAAAKSAEREALDAKRQMLAELSHDIKTPLATVLATAELMDARGAEGADKIIEKVTQIDKLLNQIYQNSLNEIGRLSVDAETADSGEILKIIKNADGGELFSYANSPRKATVSVDKLRFAECVDNIAINAKKYADGKLKVMFGMQDECFWVSFVDNGCGAEEEELAYITERFYRGARAKSVSGSGLGLYIVKMLTERMGGYMTAENAPKDGEEFGGLKITLYLRRC